MKRKQSWYWHKYFSLLFLFFSCVHIIHAQNFGLTLHVTEPDKQPVPGASILINQQKITADSTGNVFVTLPGGNYVISVSSVNHYPLSQNLVLRNDTAISVSMPLRQSLLGSITVFSNRNITRNQMGVQSISSSMLRKLPVIMGEIDPLKTITLLPGIKSGGEASAGIYVRGGGPDQNLVLLDGITVYNPNHLLGFFSIFNGEAIKNVEVIKGGIPAEYGGRLSSVISIDTKDGNKDSLRVSGGIGLISSRLSLETPIVKGKSSFVISARRTYIDQLAKLVAKSRIKDNSYYFYDLNAKADFILNKDNQLIATFYKGNDDFTFSNNNDGRGTVFNTVWGNTIAGLTWKQRISKELQQQTSAVYNSFNLDNKFGFSSIKFIFTSGLRDYQLKSDWQYASSRWLKVKWGLQYTWHQFKPGAGGLTTGVQDFKSRLSKQYAREAAAYLSTDINITPSLNLIAGLRYSYFNQVGPTSIVDYGSDGVPTGNVQHFASGKSIAQYDYPEPRLSFLYKLKGEASLKLSFTSTVQYLHLATTSSASFPSDLWVPSSKLIQPEVASQLALGFFKNFHNNMYEFSAETYYKTMSSQIEFKPGAQLLLNQNLEGEMIFGSGKAYGLELFFQKKRGRLNGWIGYTLSRAERTFDKLNGGQSFAYRYDRTHDLSVVANYLLGKKWEFSAVFVYGTGNALTLPSGRFTYGLGYNAQDAQPIFTVINQYDKINEYRMPAYHRLDIAFTYTPKPASIKHYRSSWNFSVYNLYNRSNPYFIYLDSNTDTQTVQAKQVYLFPVVPSITWNFKF